jgi:hypothetical protein
MKKMMLIFVAVICLLWCSILFAEDIVTRFGSLTINNENILLFKGRPFTPQIQGNNSLSLAKKIQMDKKDVILIEDNGGTSCPSQYYFVTMSASGAKATPAFGTCSDLIKIKQKGDIITVSMPGFKGSFEPAREQKKAAKEKHIFTFKDDIVTENGKPIK